MNRAIAVLLTSLLAACVTRAVDEQLADPQMSYSDAPPAAPIGVYSVPLEASVGDRLPSAAPSRAADAGADAYADADASNDADARPASNAPPTPDDGGSEPDCVVDGRGYDCPTRASYYACNGVDVTCVLGCAATDVRCFERCSFMTPDPSGCTLVP